ncbi:MAG: restriction endonuclease subunit S [Parcubacteria group bacterium]|nr:restriction endonuclease subunit S [Parcubacteria group bacterium]
MTKIDLKTKEKLKTTWRTVRLGDVADIQWGDTNTTKAAYRPSGYLAFSATGPDGFMDHYDFDRDGVVLSAIGANCGETWFISGKWSCIKNTIRLWGEEGKSDTRFLYYKTHNKNLWPQRGSAQPFISQTDARNLEIKIPEDINEQKRIAGVLSAFDEKIENNNRIIKALEEMAQAIFKKQFTVPVDDLPEGWEVKEAGELVKRLPQGKTYRPEELGQKGVVPVYDQSSGIILGYHNNAPAFSASIDEPVAIFGDHTCRMKIVAHACSLGPNVVPFIGRDYPTMFVYYLTIGGVIQREYKRHWIEFEQQQFAVPPPSLAKEFASFVKPIVQKIVEAENENQKLAAMRDLLLPRLMSGELLTNK